VKTCDELDLNVLHSSDEQRPKVGFGQTMWQYSLQTRVSYQHKPQNQPE
jgi:hypothetical protein